MAKPKYYLKPWELAFKAYKANPDFSVSRLYDDWIWFLNKTEWEKLRQENLTPKRSTIWPTGVEYGKCRIPTECLTKRAFIEGVLT